MYRIICVFLLCAYAVRVETAYKDCGSKVGRYTSVSVSNCDETQQYCILKKNANATITIKFDVDNDVAGVKAVVHGVIAGVPVPFILPSPEACDNEDSGLTCPLTKANGPYTYTKNLFVEKSYPKLSLKVKWELQDENGEDIVCVEIPAKIQ